MTRRLAAGLPFVLFGAVLGLLLLVFQPPLGFLVAGILLITAALRPARARSFGGVGAGMAATYVVLLAPLLWRG